MMRMEKAGEQRRQLRKTQAEWESRKNYRIWDANRKIFLYPENWVEPELRLPTRFRESLREVMASLSPHPGAATHPQRTRRPPPLHGARLLATRKPRIRPPPAHPPPPPLGH